MGDYLTKKATIKRPWEVFIVLILGLIGGVSLYNCIEFFVKNEVGTAFAGLFITVALLYPAVRIVRRIILRVQAKNIARQLEMITEERISFPKLQGMIPMKRLVKTLEKLIKGEYMQNIHIDWENNGLVLYAPHKQVEKNRFMEMECLNCGAKNAVFRGRIGRCEFCNQPLLSKENNGKG